MKRNAAAVCETCPYWIVGASPVNAPAVLPMLSTVKQGECRAGPPSVLLIEGQFGNAGLMPVRPQTAPDYTCGAHPEFLAPAPGVNHG